MSVEKVTELFQKLNTAATPEDRTSAGAEVVKAAKAAGVASLAAVSEQIKAAIDDAAPLAREGGLAAFSLVLAEFGTKAEPYLFPLVPIVLERASDKAAPIRAAAEAAATEFFAVLNPYSTENMLPTLFDAMAQARSWQTKVLALQLVAGMAKTAPVQIASCLHEIVPRLTGRWTALGNPHAWTCVHLSHVPCMRPCAGMHGICYERIMHGRGPYSFFSLLPSQTACLTPRSRSRPPRPPP